MSKMFIIAGLGNPTKEYEGTRHNVGFDVIDRLSEKYNIAVDTKKHRAFIGKGMIAGQKVILAKPQTYMNPVSYTHLYSAVCKSIYPAVSLCDYSRRHSADVPAVHTIREFILRGGSSVLSRLLKGVERSCGAFPEWQGDPGGDGVCRREKLFVEGLVGYGKRAYRSLHRRAREHT